jgi:hypothetical protein
VRTRPSRFNFVADRHGSTRALPSMHQAGYQQRNVRGAACATASIMRAARSRTAP